MITPHRLATTLSRLFLALALTLGALAAFPAAPAAAAALTVTNGNDAGAGSLRATLAAAAPGDTIAFAPGITAVTLTSAELDLTKNVTIQGTGMGGVTIRRSSLRGTPAFRIFRVGPGVSATLRGLTIANGYASADNGGGIFNDRGNLTLESSVVSGNTADGDTSGGGIYSRNWEANAAASVTLLSTTLTGNSAGHWGGGLATGTAADRAGMDITLRDSTIANNTAFLGGGISNLVGGVHYSATITLAMSNSTIANNTGGGIFSDVDNAGTSGTFTIAGSTISGNAGGGITAIALGGSAVSNTLTNSTVSSNTGSDHTGIYALATSGSSATLGLTHVTIADNTATNRDGYQLYASGQVALAYRGLLLAHSNTALGGTFAHLDSGATASSQSYNISQRDLPAANFTDLINANPLLDPLANNGGPTLTHLPAAGSPALDRIPTSLCTLSSDQRGVARPQSGNCDAGAVERTPRGIGTRTEGVAAIRNSGRDW